jgi:hypothetical protein
MTWKKTSSILNSRINHHGLGGMVSAGQVCMEAERLLPGLFRAVSFSNGILHLELSKSNLKALKMQEGRLLDELSRFATERQLPAITRLRLTYLTA